MNSPCVNCGADAKVCKECDWYNGVWISKDQYEARLKADKIAMLTELQAEVNTIPINADNSEPFRLGQASAYDKCENLIQQKIDKLKSESEDNKMDGGKIDA